MSDERELLHETLCKEAFWMVNKKLAKKIGINGAILLADFVSKEKYFKDTNKLSKDGFFFNTQISIEKDTTFSPYEQRAIIKKLIKNELITKKKKKVFNGDLVNHFKIDHVKILNIISEPCEKTSFPETKKLDEYNNNKPNNNKPIPKGIVSNSSEFDNSQEDISKKEIPVKEKETYSCELVEHWNSKPNLRKHKNTSDTYKKAMKLFQLIRAGAFGRKHDINSTYSKRNDITVVDLNREISVEEIKDAIDKYAEAYEFEIYKDRWPKNCVDFIYNPMTKSSYFYKFLKGPVKKQEKIKDEKVYNIYKDTFFKNKILNDVEEGELIKAVNFVITRQREYHSVIGQYYTPTSFKEMQFYKTHITYLLAEYFDKGVFDIFKIGTEKIWLKYVVRIKQQRGNEYDLRPNEKEIRNAKEGFYYNQRKMKENDEREREERKEPRIMTRNRWQLQEATG